MHWSKIINPFTPGAPKLIHLYLQEQPADPALCFLLFKQLEGLKGATLQSCIIFPPCFVWGITKFITFTRFPLSTCLKTYSQGKNFFAEATAFLN